MPWRLVVGLALIFFGSYHIRHNKQIIGIHIKGKKRVYGAMGFQHVAKFQDNSLNKKLVSGSAYAGSIFVLLVGIALLAVGGVKLVELIYYG